MGSQPPGVVNLAAGNDQSHEAPIYSEPMAPHRTTEELVDFLPTLDDAPKDRGTLRLLVRRPTLNQREVLTEGELDLSVGLVGDNWSTRGSRSTPDGSADPQAQLNIMGYPMVEFLAQDPSREPLAGDQMYFDLDLSHDNLPAGSRVAIGSQAVIEVTEKPHTGCAKFIERFGAEAMKFVNGTHGRPRRLRGLCARVVVAGVVRVGDEVVVLSRP